MRPFIFHQTNDYEDMYAFVGINRDCESRFLWRKMIMIND